MEITQKRALPKKRIDIDLFHPSFATNIDSVQRSATTDSDKMSSRNPKFHTCNTRAIIDMQVSIPICNRLLFSPQRIRMLIDLLKKITPRILRQINPVQSELNGMFRVSERLQSNPKLDM